MRKINFIAILFVIIIAFSCDGNNASSKVKKENIESQQKRVQKALSSVSEMVFEKEFYDFGEISQEKKVSTEFKFKNTGKGDLIISNAYGSCGCTVPDYPKEPIKPGEEASIKVTFSPKGRVGINNKTVTLIANTKKGKKTLKIKAKVLN